MGKLLRYRFDPAPEKAGFLKKRNNKSRYHLMEASGQLNLFKHQNVDYSVNHPGRVVSLFPATNPFEEALRLDNRNDPRAGSYYNQAIREGIGSADAWCNLGILNASAGADGKAIACFQNALGNNSQHPEANYNLGNMYLDNSDFPNAIFHYKAALENKPDFQEALFNMAIVYIELEKFAQARNYLLLYNQHVSEQERRLTDRIIKKLKYFK